MNTNNAVNQTTRKILAASHPKLYDFYMNHEKSGTKTLTVSGIPLSFDEKLNSLKRKLHNEIGTPYTPRRTQGKGTTEFTFGGFAPTDGSQELTVVGYINVITECSNITEDEVSALNDVCALTQKSLAA